MKLTPEGSEPTSASVGAGTPTAVTVNELVVALEKVVAFALVIAVAEERDMVKFAVNAASVGMMSAPHFVSASTAAAETGFRLMT